MVHGSSATRRGLLPAASVVQESDASYQTRPRETADASFGKISDTAVPPESGQH
jgi:hypothetical protein